MKKRFISVLFLIGMVLLLAACSKDNNPTTTDNSYDFNSILNDYADKVVVATYLDLKNKTEALQTACETLLNDPTQANLNAAADAWKAAREPWELSEAFLFGPVHFLSIDPSMDTWPVDESQLQSVLNGNFDLTPDFVRNGLGYSLRGYHTIEYLLFKDGQKRNAADLTDREEEYLASASIVLAEDADMVYQEWTSGFASEIKNAGKTGSRYNSQVQAALEIVEGIIAIADEVGNGKINEPYVTKNVSAVESQFSWNSTMDFANNIKSIRNAYTGGYSYGSDGTGLDEFIKSRNPELNTKVLAEIDSAISSINAIPIPFRSNLNADVQIQAAIKACNTILETYQTEVKPLVTQ